MDNVVEVVNDRKVFKGDASFQTILDNGITWNQFVESTRHQNIYLGGPPSECACCIVGKHDDPPEEFEEYLVDVIVDGGTASTEDVSPPSLIKIAAVNTDAASTTINGLVKLAMDYAASSNATSPQDVTIKCFAQQPRLMLPTLLLALNDSKSIGCMRLHFCSVDKETMSNLLRCNNIRSIELRQCTVIGLEEALETTTVVSGARPPPSKLMISCTMPEFAAFAKGFATNTTITNLDLLLHFYLQGNGMDNFCGALAQNKTLVNLSIKYLDLNDDNWTLFMTSIQHHPTIQSIRLAFTDNFVDNFRKLTPERRTSRTQAVLNLVRNNTNIRDIIWPNFQKDENIDTEIQKLLEQRN